MSSKKKKKEPEVPEEVYVPLMERPKFRIFYSITVYALFSIGILIIILAYTVFVDAEGNANPFALFGGLGVLGVGIILMTMRSSRKHSAPPEEEKEKDEDTLQMRTRR